MIVTLEQHRGEVRADLLRFYGLRLDQILDDEDYGPREVYDLVKHLPSDAALWRDQAPSNNDGDVDGGGRLVTKDPKKIRGWLASKGVT